MNDKIIFREEFQKTFIPNDKILILDIKPDSAIYCYSYEIPSNFCKVYTRWGYRVVPPNYFMKNIFFTPLKFSVCKWYR